MEFFKKNWAKLDIVILMILAGTVYIIALIQSTLPVNLFRQTAGSVAALVFFFGTAAYLICKMFNQNWPKWILLCVGVVATVFAVAFKIYVIDTRPPVFTFFEYLALTHACTFLVVFGLIPLVNGLSKVFMCGSKKKEKETTKPAPAKAVAK